MGVFVSGGANGITIECREEGSRNVVALAIESDDLRTVLEYAGEDVAFDILVKELQKDLSAAVDGCGEMYYEEHYSRRELKMLDEFMTHFIDSEEFDRMRYHFEKPAVVVNQYGETYLCNHPVYDICTLFRIKDKGLAVIQQRCAKEAKMTYWSEIDDYLRDAIYLHPKFIEFFDKRAGEPDKDGLYPTVTVRQIMWALKMKPLKKERWETVFDRKDI